MSNAQTRDQGIGLRIGDPLGITYKSYFDRKGAVELIFGSTSANRHDSYYKSTFDSRSKYDGNRYVDHSVKYTLAFQGRMVWHESFPANVEGRLDWYWGLGAHVRLSDVKYSFFNENDILRTDNDTNFDLGPEGILGIEYEFLDYPIVGFSEVSLMGELVDNPFRFRFFGAVGIRYAF
ncbi:hypothetical protein E1176_03670 [Fulvivirga sp. RKSG066]|nr:hypothetical protein [Fulvivirga aurantia]